MSVFMKKQASAFYLNAIAAVLGVVGTVSMVMSSTMNSAYALNSFTKTLLFAICGILLVGLAIYAPNRWGNHDYVSTLSVLGAIGLFSAVIGNVISERVMLISGLFSFNSGNTVGWSVFYVSVVCLASLLVAIILLIVGAFLKSVKEG